MIVLADIENEPVDLEQFVPKLRVYTISDQDDSGPWIRKMFPELFYIASPGVHSGGKELSYEWFYYGEPGTLVLSTGRTGAPLRREGANTAEASFAAPNLSKPETMHFILAVTDQGTPPLTRYRRVIITVYP